MASGGGVAMMVMRSLKGVEWMGMKMFSISSIFCPFSSGRLIRSVDHFARNVENSTLS